MAWMMVRVFTATLKHLASKRRKIVAILKVDPMSETYDSKGIDGNAV